MEDVHGDPELDATKTRTVLIRSLDLYRRVDGSWIQIGSNICAITDPLDDGELGEAV